MFARLYLLVAVAGLCLAGPAITPSLAAAQAVDNTKKERPESFDRVAIIQFHGPIDGRLHQYFFSRIAQAEKSGVDLVVLEIDSPGGLLAESFEIGEKLRSIDWAHTVAFVPDEAISGGALVALGCDEIIVDDDANYGDIGAIWADPSMQAFRFVPAKALSYIVGEAKILAESKGKPHELVEAMIDRDVAVYTKTGNDGNLRYKKHRIDSDDDKPAAPWKVIEESGAERFLTLTGARAKQLGLADAIAGDDTELAAELNFDARDVKRFQPNSTDSIVYYLNSTIVTGLLILIGLIALYIEFSAPGVGVGGLIAGLCAVLFFWSRFLGGTSGWLEVLLFLAGLVFILMEVFVIPGWGVSGLVGLLLLFASVMMASQDFVLPQTGRQWNKLVSTLLMLMCSGFVFMICAVFITRKFGHLPVFGRMVLDPATSGVSAETDSVNEDGKPVPQPHPVVSVGDWGRAESMLRPAGRAGFSGSSLDVISDGSLIESGCQIRVIRIQGNVVTVTEVEDDDEIGRTTYPADSEA